MTDQSIYSAVVQLSSGSDVEANIAAADTRVRAAVAAGAKLIVLPEKWTVIGTAEDLRAGAQSLNGPAISWARDTARELGVDLVAGSIAELPWSAPLESSPSEVSSAETRLANASVHVGPDGEIRAVYRKLHMFDVEIEGKPYRESDTDEPGDEIVLSETAHGARLGLSICYDVRFPELYRALALRGARIVTIPAAFTAPTTRDHWEVMVRARAIENQVFVLAANQTGSHPGGHRSGGQSMIVDPWGTVLARAGEEVGFVAAELDFAEQDAIRERVPLLAHRRPEVYGWSDNSEARLWPEGSDG